MNRFFRQVGTLYPKTGYDKFGRDISGTGISVNCRFENRTKTKNLKTGQVVSILGRVFFSGTTIVNTEDRFSFQGINYKIYSVDGAVDMNGNQRLIECEVQKWAPQ